MRKMLALIAALFVSAAAISSPAALSDRPDLAYLDIVEKVTVTPNGVAVYNSTATWTEKVCRSVRIPTRSVNVCRTVTFTNPAPVPVRFCASYVSKGTTRTVCQTYTVKPKVPMSPSPTPTPSVPADPSNPTVPTIPAPGQPSPTTSPAPTITPAPRNPADDQLYTFSMLDGDNNPVRFDVCKTLSWSVDGTEAEKSLTRSAMAELSAVSGITLQEVPWDGFKPFIDPAPTTPNPAVNIVVRFYDEKDLPDLRGDVSGVTSTRSWTSSVSPRPQISFAAVAIERNAASPLRKSGGMTVWPVLLHELGHSVGLGHALDSNQIMFAAAWPGTHDEYQNGDRLGLAKVGRIGAACPTVSRIVTR